MHFFLFYGKLMEMSCHKEADKWDKDCIVIFPLMRN